MFRGIAIPVVLALLACTSNSWAEEKETSTPEELRQLGDLAVGRWVGDIKFVADWPGEDLGKGKRVVGYLQYEWVADKKAFRRRGQRWVPVVASFRPRRLIRVVIPFKVAMSDSTNYLERSLVMTVTDASRRWQFYRWVTR